MKKKLLSLLLVASMLLAVLPMFSIGTFADDGEPEAKEPNSYEALYVQDGLLTLVTTYDLLVGDAIDALTDNNGNPISLIATDDTKDAAASAVNGGLLLGANTTFELSDVIPLTENESDYTYQFVFELADLELANKTIATESQFSWEGSFAARPAFTAGPINIMVEPIPHDAAEKILTTSKSQYISDYQFTGGVSKTYIQMYDYLHSNYDRTNKLPRLMAFEYEDIATLTLRGSTTAVKTYEGTDEDGGDLFVTTYGGSISSIMRDNTAVTVNADSFIENSEYTTMSQSISIGNDFPMVLYSVRAYNRELSTVEINQNHFADIADKFNLNTFYFNFLSDYGKQIVYSAFAGIGLDDISASNAQDLLDSTIETVPVAYQYSYDDLIVSEGLVANLSFDSVSANDFCDVTEFKQGEQIIAQFLRYSNNAPDKYSWSYGDGFLKTGLNGALDMSSVINGLDSFTVQVTMAHNSDTEEELFTTDVRTAIDADRVSRARISVIHAGLLRLQYRFVEKNANTASGGVSDTALKAWNATTGPTGSYYDTLLNFDDGETPSLLANALNAPFDFSISQITDDEGAVTATLYDKTTMVGSSPVTVPAEGESLPPKALVFGAGVNVSIYSVRVYNRALTETELKQNRFADFARQFHISLALFNRMNDEQKLAVYDSYANVALTDESVTKESIENTIANIYMKSNLDSMASLLLRFNGFQMATTDNVAMRPLFAVDNAFLAFAESGAKVSIGILSAPASVKDLTVSATANGITAAKGVTHTEIYSTNAGTKNFVYNGKSISRFASPISPEDYTAEYVFRAYVVLEMNGTYSIAYCDTASDLFGTSVSAAELATYFYGEGYIEGGVRTVYDAIHAK